MKIVIKSFIAAAMIISSILNIGCTNQQTTVAQNNKAQTFSNADDAAKSALIVLQKLTTDKNLQGTMSLTPDEAKQLTVGKALDIEELSYNKLLEIKADSSFAISQIIQSGLLRKLYPLEISGSPKTTAVVSSTDNNWKLSSAGDNSYIELLSLKQASADSDIQVVEVPGMHLKFLGYILNGEKFYISDSNVPGTKIIKGQPIEERQFSRELASYAHIFDSKYGEKIRQKKIVD
jgi:hypothetical protein